LDYDTYIMDLEGANVGGADQQPPYSLLYNVLDDLNMKSLLPEDYDDLARRLASDDDLWNTYYR